MNRLSVSALALIATSLTLPAFGAEPQRSNGRAPQGERPSSAAKDSGRSAERGATRGSYSDASPDEKPGSDEPTPSRESDSLLPNDHKETPRETERPLVIRRTPEKPLELSAQTPSDSIWIKLGVCGLIVAGGAYLFRKRGLFKAPVRTHTMTIVARTAIGVRSELLLVEVDGQKLLLGVTPGSISRLAVMPGNGDAPALLEETLDPVARADQEPGFGVALDTARVKLEEFAARVKSRAPEAPPARAQSRTSHNEAPTSAAAEEAEYEREVARREAARARARQSHVERELKELRASRPETRSRPDLGEQAQSLLRLREARGR